MLSAIKEKYPTFSKASAAYSTSLQPMLLADTEKAYSEKSPTLSDLERIWFLVSVGKDAVTDH